MWTADGFIVDNIDTLFSPPLQSPTGYVLAILGDHTFETQRSSAKQYNENLFSLKCIRAKFGVHCSIIAGKSVDYLASQISKFTQQGTNIVYVGHGDENGDWVMFDQTSFTRANLSSSINRPCDVWLFACNGHEWDQAISQKMFEYQTKEGWISDKSR